jgi:thioredoxin-dependent peroxiredoxin
MLASGTPAPSFQLESSEGGQVSLESLDGKTAVLYFYPRDNTPGCTIEAQEFRDLLSEFRAAGAEVFGVSRDSISSHCKFRDKYGLTFPLLSDPEGATMERYQAWGEKVMYGKKVTGVIRSTVVIDPQGKIARHWAKVTVKGHAAKVLEVVQSLGGGGAREGGGKGAKTAKGTKKSEPDDPGARGPQGARKSPEMTAKAPGHIGSTQISKSSAAGRTVDKGTKRPETKALDAAAKSKAKAPKGKSAATKVSAKNATAAKASSTPRPARDYEAHGKTLRPAAVKLPSKAAGRGSAQRVGKISTQSASKGANKANNKMSEASMAKSITSIVKKAFAKVVKSVRAKAAPASKKAAAKKPSARRR